jgi:hypothetical protein
MTTALESCPACQVGRLERHEDIEGDHATDRRERQCADCDCIVPDQPEEI